MKVATEGPSETSRLRFGEFEMDVRSGELWKRGDPIRIQPQPFRILSLLVQRAGQVVLREEIQATVWGDATFVDFEQAMNFSIKQIRAALGDQADRPRYIETLPRRGYRFIAVVEVLASRDDNPSSDEVERTTAEVTRRPAVGCLALIAAGVAGGAVLGMGLGPLSGNTAGRTWHAVPPLEDGEPGARHRDGANDPTQRTRATTPAIATAKQKEKR